MTTFDLLKAEFLPNPNSNYFSLCNLLFGGFSAAVAVTFTYPSDLLKRKL